MSLAYIRDTYSVPARRAADHLGVTPEIVWGIFAGKHWDAIMTYCRCGQVESEPVRGRILDLILYSYLLLGLVEDVGGET
mgnify:CR=1 FL=1